VITTQIAFPPMTFTQAVYKTSLYSAHGEKHAYFFPVTMCLVMVIPVIVYAGRRYNEWLRHLHTPSAFPADDKKDDQACLQASDRRVCAIGL